MRLKSMLLLAAAILITLLCVCSTSSKNVQARRQPTWTAVQMMPEDRRLIRVKRRGRGGFGGGGQKGVRDRLDYKKSDAVSSVVSNVLVASLLTAGALI